MLAGAIFVIGNLAVILVYISGEVYQRSALVHEKELVKKMVVKDVRSLMREIDTEAQMISNALADNELFIKAMAKRKRDEVEDQLKQRMAFYIQSNRKSAIKKIFAYGPTLEFIAQSPQADNNNLLIPGMCPEYRGRALREANNGKTTAVRGVCYSGKKFFVVSVIPLSEFASKGFIEIIAQPRQYLDRKSTRLNSSHTDISRMPSSA